MPRLDTITSHLRVQAGHGAIVPPAVAVLAANAFVALPFRRASVRCPRLLPKKRREGKKSQLGCESQSRTSISCSCLSLSVDTSFPLPLPSSSPRTAVSQPGNEAPRAFVLEARTGLAGAGVSALSHRRLSRPGRTVQASSLFFQPALTLFSHSTAPFPFFLGIARILSSY